jgi:hypothetical protein
LFLPVESELFFCSLTETGQAKKFPIRIFPHKEKEARGR